ncbi:hypothetical protein [Herbiconiux sp. VKM Ac-2851]|uniref:hypothetical protein n=1 Tax=Herbiconiux sp. VKM Ac-2851 TaxID=2739025 RepID=UPI001567811A|nr:hypothetical protein [Herbiconiux sp. VKM Ac-2851]NQX36091.1 hypothetical protein [Herbiconiux sp. VKM Ac-2851]
MRVLLKLVLDCDPDAAWRAIRSPAVFREVSSPLVEIESLAADGFPTVWEPGQHPVEMRGGGVIPMGKQIIRLNFETRQHGDVRIVHDSGQGVTGAVSTIKLWDHQMAIAPDPAGTGKTLYRDQLKIGAGVLTPFAWYSLWAFWQWRGRKLQQLAPTWAYDLPKPADAEPDADAGSATETDAAAEGSGA